MAWEGQPNILHTKHGERPKRVRVLGDNHRLMMPNYGVSVRYWLVMLLELTPRCDKANSYSDQSLHDYDAFGQTPASWSCPVALPAQSLLAAGDAGLGCKMRLSCAWQHPVSKARFKHPSAYTPTPTTCSG